ncbi:MAG TPA: aldo/keto reductase, partial [Polyangiales bacterium]|nr:aldo/keto reductase [Polyangiales bacterium]
GPFVLGGNVFGWTVQRDEAFRLLDAFVERGGKAIDTADVYSVWAPGATGGDSEKILGEWLARGPRSRAQIHTKVAKWPAHPGLSAANIQAAVEGSLKRLKTDYIDLYYAHEDDQKVPQEEYVRAFDALVKAGKVRTLGASNFTAERLTSALSIARSQGLASFQVSQDHYNLVERGFERSLQPVLEREGLVELPYFSLASGFLTGKYRPGKKVDSSRAGGAQKLLDRPRAAPLLKALDEIAAGHKVSVTAVSLAWLKGQRSVAAPVASARTIEQLSDLFESATLRLTGDELGALADITAP